VHKLQLWYLNNHYTLSTQGNKIMFIRTRTESVRCISTFHSICPCKYNQWAV